MGPALARWEGLTPHAVDQGRAIPSRGRVKLGMGWKEPPVRVGNMVVLDIVALFIVTWLAIWHTASGIPHSSVPRL